MERPKLVALLSVISIGGFVLGLSFGQPSVQANPPPSNAPTQTWVFDGAYEHSALHALSLTSSGMVASVEAALECPDGTTSLDGFALLSDPEVGAHPPMGSRLGFGPALDPSVAAILSSPPIDPALVEDDCVALANEGGVQSYLAPLVAQGTLLASQLEACIDDVRQTACEVLDAGDLAAAICQADPDRCTTVFPPSTPMKPYCDQSTGISLSGSASCLECRVALEHLPFLVSRAESLLASCKNHLSALQIHLSRLQDFLSGQFQTHPGDGWPTEVLWHVECAEKNQEPMDALLSDVAGITDSCSHESLVENCEICPDDPGELTVLLPSGVVGMRQSARHLGRLVGTFRSTATTTSDPALAATYDDLAARLSDLRHGEVLEVSVPVDSSFTQQFVALRRPDAPPDAHSPLAVVLTLVRSNGEPPPLNRADRELLDGALETFKNTLDPERSFPSVCTDDTDCPEGQVCAPFSAMCVPEPLGCMDDLDCPMLQFCDDGICVPGQ